MSINPNPYVRELEPYKISISADLAAHEKEKFIKLDWNESTYPPAPGVRKALINSIEKGSINYYPDVHAIEVKAKLSSLLGVPVSYIQVFNGSDAALRDISMTYLGENDSVLIREPVYTQIYTFIQARGARVVSIMGSDPFEKAIGKYIEVLDQQTIKMVYIVNPNNPTGTHYSRDEIEFLVSKYPEVLFIVDEAYTEFTQVSVVDLTGTLPNLIVARTFSKAFGLAGIRIGYIVCDPEILQYIDRIRNGKEVNALAQIAAITAIDEINYMHEKVEMVQINRTWLVRQLQESGYEVIDTPANFILLKVVRVNKLLEGLRERKILVRDRSYMPQLEGCVRISIGIMAEMEKLLAALIELKPQVLNSSSVLGHRSYSTTPKPS